MALEAVQAQAGHASIESTRIYLHLANDWLAREYLAAAEAIDAQLDPLAARARVVSRLARDPQVEALVAAYRADLEAAGMFAENEVTSPARSFLLRVGPDGWSAMTLDQQLAVRGHDRRLVAWLIVTGRVRPTADYLVASKLRVGKVAAGIYREFHGGSFRSRPSWGSIPSRRSCSGGRSRRSRRSPASRRSG